MVVVTSKYLDCFQDLLGYQALVLEARMEQNGDSSLGYHRRFRRRAAVDPTAVWAKINPTSWNITFTGQAKTT